MSSKYVSAFNKPMPCSKISDFMASDSNIQIIRIEFSFTEFILKYNISFVAADCMSKLLIVTFPNLPEVKKYTRRRTKSAYLVV